ncbi:MAG: bifunctional phosphopantothenoylcysteine decarboxylase/phosphopantothenate--cysteine ligase CoaBC [Bacteroidetes bacterium]|nr:MAG: bifunctional phosphopantothenoylcysteine decarboxylase/phosphopantothenate--cysteine ligase CoaBC [Bacteroidota bacterium]REK51244.1 MAG: bifunctional phosphopantothenoylcysteine decarboxylase/phosphopantothenate--cysteine ligase CoaBC [Bacteroidota bacterium]
MSLLYNRKVLLGVSGSIAAYKSAHLVRELIKRGAEVQVVITDAAKDFVTPLTLSTLSTRPVYSAFIEDEQKAYGVWNNHVEMGLWADLMVIAPASSNTLSKMATGACDNLLTAVYLSAKCPVFAAPAMDLDMYANGATSDNIKVLEQRGVGIIDSDYGELASGLVGKGRMAEPEAIADHLEEYLSSTLPLYGKKVLINAGPTHEHLDPVRFLGNNSSGKMGAAIAAAARDLGGNVHLVLGPTQAALDLKGIKVTRVTSADDMLSAMVSEFTDSSLTVCCAAVSDYKPVSQAEHKIKKSDEGNSLTISLEKTPDILSTLGKMKGDGNFLVGFALETRDGESYAKQKLIKKNASAIVLNTLGKEGVGFETDTNEVSVYTVTGKTFSFPLTSKIALGKSLLELFMSEFNLSDA